MDKRIAGLLGAATALVTLGASNAAMARQLEAAMSASSYADLLKPVTDPVALLAASDAVSPGDTTGAAKLERADYHHHHHHHRARRRSHHHHHRDS